MGSCLTNLHICYLPTISALINFWAGTQVLYITITRLNTRTR
ncbi:hypothetical protein [Rubritalea tangerina]